jgi:heme exporter protein A
MSLEVINLKFEYPDDAFDCSTKYLINNTSFKVSEGSLLHLSGKNGSGKTTILKLIAGLLRPEKGEIRYFNKPIYNNLISYHENICYVGHKTGISLTLTVFENCFFDLKHTHMHQGIDDLLKRFSLFEVRNTPCALLSSGNRRRVGLLRLMLSRARLWLVDEPIIALDKDAIAFFVDSLKDHTNRGGMVIYTSHQQIDLPTANHTEYTL